MKNILYILLFISNLFSAFTESQTGWNYVQGGNQTFYIFLSPMNVVDTDGTSIEGYGDGSNGISSDTSYCGLNPGCDVLGAFMTHELDVNGNPFNESTCDDIGGYYVNNQCDVCVGWSYYNSYNESGGGSLSTTLALMGFDSSFSGEYDYY